MLIRLRFSVICLSWQPNVGTLMLGSGNTMRMRSTTFLSDEFLGTYFNFSSPHIKKDV